MSGSNNKHELVWMEVHDLMDLFEEYEPFINEINELILIPEFNVYFRLDDVKSTLDLKCKVLEWLSRDAYKTEFYDKVKYNEQMHKSILSSINAYLFTNFTFEDMEKIYTKLGNNINRELCIKFIENNYDMKLLEVN